MAELTPTRTSRLKVLVVDDDPIVLQVVHEWLAAAGYTVFTREQALGTANWVAEEKPDVVVLDVGMPALAGNELANLMHRNHNTAQVAVILYSAMEQEALLTMAKSSGAIGAIQKTSNGRAFLTQFERIIAVQRVRQARA
ncbi:MAG TPA: response regulator [Polyangiaceae bacterium]